MSEKSTFTRPNARTKEERADTNESESRRSMGQKWGRQNEDEAETESESENAAEELTCSECGGNVVVDDEHV